MDPGSAIGGTRLVNGNQCAGESYATTRQFGHTPSYMRNSVPR